MAEPPGIIPTKKPTIELRTKAPAESFQSWRLGRMLPFTFVANTSRMEPSALAMISEKAKSPTTTLMKSMPPRRSTTP